MVNKKTQKIEAQVVDAIRNLQAVQGSTQREISNYIAQEYNLPLTNVNRQVQLALKRGVNYGILQRLKGGCFTYNQQLFNGLPFDLNPELACKGRRRRRKSRKRKSRRRTRSKKRPYNIREGAKERSKKAEEIVNEIDTSDLKTLTKQTNNRSSSLLRKDTPGSDGSSTTGKSEEAHE